MMKNITLLALLACLTCTACAVQVGIAVEFPNQGTYQKCVDVPRGSDAYMVLGETELDLTWTKDPVYGHSLCQVLDTGCLDSGCDCVRDYWNFYIQRGGKWSHSQVGFDGGETCKDHYCVREGDVLGFTFNSDGAAPGEIAFEDICPPREKKEAPGITGQIIANPGRYPGFFAAAVLFLMLGLYIRHKPWEYI